MFDRSSPLPLVYQIEQVICYWIIAGKYKVNDYLPSQLEMSELFKVSRITVRSAVFRLISQGILESYQGKGTCVRRIPASTIYNTVSKTSVSISIQSIFQDSECSIINTEYNLINSPSSCPVPQWEIYHFVQGIRKHKDIPIVCEDTYSDGNFFSKNNLESIIYMQHDQIKPDIKITHYTESFFSKESGLYLSQNLQVPLQTILLGVKRLSFCAQYSTPIECRISYLLHENYGNILFTLPQEKINTHLNKEDVYVL